MATFVGTVAHMTAKKLVWSGLKTPPESGGRLLRLERDGVAEGFEAADEAALDVVALALIEVGGAQLPVGGPVAEQVVADDQDGVGDGDDGPLLAASGCEAAILGGEVGALGARGSLGGLDERRE